MVLVTHRDNPIKDVAALVAAAKANPDKLSLASFGVATISHFAGELFKSSAGIKMVHLPYRGKAALYRHPYDSIGIPLTL